MRFEGLCIVPDLLCPADAAIQAEQEAVLSPAHPHTYAYNMSHLSVPSLKAARIGNLGSRDFNFQSKRGVYQRFLCESSAT